MTDTYTDQQPQQQTWGLDTAPGTVPAASESAAEASEKPAARASRGRRKSRTTTTATAGAAFDKATVIKVLETRTQLDNIDTSTADTVAKLAGCDTDPDSLTVALLGDTSWVDGLRRVADLATQEPFDALVALVDMDTDGRRSVFSTCNRLNNTAGARLDTSSGKASKHIVDQLTSLTADRLAAIDGVLQLVG